MRKIFISHSHSDKPFVHRLARDLERFGYPVWIDEAEIKYGESLITKIHDAIEEAVIIIAVISLTSVKSKWVTQELDLALNFKMERDDISVIPILIDYVAPPLFLKSMLYADFRSTVTYHKALGQLLRNLQQLSPVSNATKDVLENLPLPIVPYFPEGTIKFLEKLYGEKRLFKGPNGEVYPIIVHSYFTDQPESILGPLVEDMRTFPDSSAYFEFLRRQDVMLWNGRTFILRTFEFNQDDLQLTCSVGRYFDALNTCDLLEQELITSMTRHRNQAFEDLYQAMERRYLTHGGKTGAEAVKTAWVNSDRSSAIAISTLLVFKEGHEYRYFVRRRSPHVFVHSGLYHVVPSFMFQPMTGIDQQELEYSITHNVLREYSEEVFSRTDVGKADAADKHNYFYDFPEVAVMREMLESGSAQLFVSGIALNLLNLRPEILTVLIIHDEEWFKAHMSEIKFCRFEFVAEAPLEQNDAFAMSLPLYDQRIFQPGNAFAPEHCVAPGGACLMIGVGLAREIVRKRR